MLLPLPSNVPPQELEYHCAVAPVPAEPPFNVNVVLLPEQIVDVPLILLGAIESELTVTVIEAQIVVLHVPLYLAKYVVVVVGETVILLPVPTAVPPQESVNHCAVEPDPAVPPDIVNVVELPLQIVEVPVILVGATENELTVTVTDAHVVVLHVPLYRTKYVVFIAGETVILFPVPTAVPPHEPENHWAVAPTPGDPPLRVNVVESPAHMLVVPVMLVGATEFASTVTVVEAHVVVLHVPL